MKKSPKKNGDRTTASANRGISSSASSPIACLMTKRMALRGRAQRAHNAVTMRTHIETSQYMLVTRLPNGFTTAHDFGVVSALGVLSISI
jgi:hypothetical protein